MFYLQLFLLLAAVLLHATTSFSPDLIISGVQLRHHQHNNLQSLTIPRMTSDSPDGDSGDEATPKSEDASSKPAQDPTPPPQMARTPPSPPPKRLDPLLASLTRVDPQASNSNAPKKNLPLLGEVTLDQNLFIILPVTAFAILGFVSFVLVAFNSQDAFVSAIDDWNNSVLNPPTPTSIDPNECRGLCSSQQEDLEGLRGFMEGISGKK